MISVSAFVRRVEQIAARDLTYRTGGVGKDGTCDCIGLIMGAMYELGHKRYDLHSTNYFARYQVLEMKKIKELFVGQLLFRARTNQDKLNGRYMPGGRYYTGDMLDYYHVGVVTNVEPLRIIECTEYGDVTGIVISTKLGRWDYGGKLRDVNYTAQEEESEEETMLYQAKVITKEDPLTLRNAPVSGKKIGELPRGAIVDVMSTGDWPRVKCGEMLGYASAQYLERIEEGPVQENVITVSADVTIIDSAGNKFKPVGDWRVLIGGVD